MRKLEIKKLADKVMPKIEQGMSLSAIARRYKKQPITAIRWAKLLREEGYIINVNKGRPYGAKNKR